MTVFLHTKSPDVKNGSVSFAGRVTHETLRGEPGRALEGTVVFGKKFHTEDGNLRCAARILFC